METVNELHLPNFEIINKRELEDGTYIYDVAPIEDEPWAHMALAHLMLLMIFLERKN